MTVMRFRFSCLRRSPRLANSQAAPFCAPWGHDHCQVWAHHSHLWEGAQPARVTRLARVRADRPALPVVAWIGIQREGLARCTDGALGLLVPAAAAVSSGVAHQNCGKREGGREQCGHRRREGSL